MDGNYKVKKPAVVDESAEQESWCPECFTFIREDEEGTLAGHRTQSMDRCIGSGQKAEYRPRSKARGVTVLMRRDDPHG